MSFQKAHQGPVRGERYAEAGGLGERPDLLDQGVGPGDAEAVLFPGQVSPDGPHFPNDPIGQGRNAVRVRGLDLDGVGGAGAAEPGADFPDGKDGLVVLGHAKRGALFGEDQGRYLLATSKSADLLAMAKAVGVTASVVGRTGGDSLTLNAEPPISLQELRAAHEGWLPAFADGTALEPHLLQP